MSSIVRSVLARRATPLRHRVRLALAAAAVAILGTAPGALRAQAPRQSPPRHAVATWGIEDGLPSSIVLGIQQTRDGYLWLAAYEGLVRFDGVRFRTFGDSIDIPGLQRGSFVALVVDSSGTLWAASESGELVRQDRGRWSVLSAAEGLPPDRITALVLDREGGGLWAGSRLGVWHVAQGRAAPLPPPPGMATPGVIALAQGPDGALWIGTVADGILRYHRGVYTRLTTRDGLPSDRIDALHVDPDGTLWVGFYGGSGVTRVRDGRITRLGDGDTLAPRRVRSFLRDRAGTLWMAAENGLFALRGDRAELVPLQTDGLATKTEALFQDTEGNLWVGSRQGGLFRVREASVVTLAAADGLADPFAFAIAGDGERGAWIATREGVVHRPALGSAAGSVIHSPRDGVLPEFAVRDVMRDAAGDIWVATTGGLTRLPGGRAARAVTYTSRDGLADDRARVLAAGRDGSVWVGTFDGVTEWRDGRLRSYGAADGLADGYILSVFVDASGTLWVGTQTAGLFRRTAEGRFVPGPAALARQPIFRITEDADGTLWVGTARGLARVRGRGDGARAAFITARHGLPANTVYQALDDGRGALWLTGPWGIARVLRAELHAVADGRALSVTATPLGRGAGLMAREASSIGRSWRAPDGTLWFPTPVGVAVVDPARLPAQTVAPRAFVEQVVADGAVLEPEPGQTIPLALAPGTRTLEVRFTAPSFVAPEQLRFRYRLEGFDREWQYGDTRRVAYYTNLPPARYHFHVQARATDGTWPDDAAPRAGASAPPAVVLWLRPHLWQTRWFLALAVLALGTGAVLGYRVRMRALVRASAWSAREEVLRTMSLRDELTGLYNRRGLLTLAEQLVRTATRERRGFTLLFADLDGLKAINDTHGHVEGDRAIAAAAALLRETFREADIIARLGGDEFVVLLPDAASGSRARLGVAPPHARPEATDDAAQAACARLVAALASADATAGRPYRLALSLGTSRYDPAAPRPFVALLEDADHHMYAEKRRRRAALGEPR